jgi:hypothetical protein
MAERGAERSWLEPIVERVVDKVFHTHVVQLRSEISRRVAEEIMSQPGSAFSSASADLARAIAEIQLGSTQKEILRALLDASARYAARVALFVVKGNTASGWQARGFPANEALKDYALDPNAAAISRALNERVSAKVEDGEFDARFIEQFGTASNVRLMPLILKDKVAALVYADGGVEDKSVDAGSLDVLVLATGSWLEVNALRKQSQKGPAGIGEEHEPPVKSAPVSAPAFNDPFAAHAPAFAAAAAASGGAAPLAVQSTAVAEAATAEPLAGNIQAAIASQGPAPGPALSPEDEEVHRKAKRFARLLVDEIKLYNKSKLAEGRANKNLYDLLQEPIDKSRATYQKRYGNTVAASGNYFEDEIKRSLAEDDLSVMGPNFRV